MNQFNSGDYLSRMGTESDNFCDPRFKDSARSFSHRCPGFTQEKFQRGARVGVCTVCYRVSVKTCQVNVHIAIDKFLATRKHERPRELSFSSKKF